MEDLEGYSRPHPGNGILVLGLGPVSLAMARSRFKIHAHTSTSGEKNDGFLIVGKEVTILPVK